MWRIYFIQPEQVAAEIERVRQGRNTVVDELQRLQADMPADAPRELGALPGCAPDAAAGPGPG